MLFRLPRPLHGWREFFNEIVIVVIGVLLALGGAQLIDTLRSRSEVASFRETVNHELGRDLSIYQSMMASRPCVTRRTRELERFLTDARAGHHDPLARPIGRPFMQTFYFSAWDNKGSAVTDQLPFELRTSYGEVYDEFRENEKVLLNERDAWRSLAGRAVQRGHPGQLRIYRDARQAARDPSHSRHHRRACAERHELLPAAVRELAENPILR